MSKILFTNSINGIPSYDARDFTGLFSNILSNGVVFGRDASGTLGVTVQNASNRTNPRVQVHKGMAVINGAVFVNDELTNINLPGADATEYVNYGIILTQNEADLDFTLQYVNIFTSASRPSDNYVTNSTYTDATGECSLLLANVVVPPVSANQFEQVRVYERHADRRVCGMMCWLLDNVDTGDYFNSYAQNLETYNSNIQTIIDGITDENEDSIGIRVYSLKGIKSGKTTVTTLTDFNINDSAVIEAYINGFLMDLESDECTFTVSFSTANNTVTVNANNVPLGNNIDLLIYMPTREA